LLEQKANVANAAQRKGGQVRPARRRPTSLKS
jgi:hypothetical protein